MTYLRPISARFSFSWVSSSSRFFADRFLPFLESVSLICIEASLEASLHKVPFGAHGYCSNFCLSIFDREWKADLTLEEGLEIIRKCKAELAARFLIAQPKFLVKIADADGVRTMEL